MTLQVASEFTEALATGDSLRALKLMQFLVLLNHDVPGESQRTLRLEKSEILEVIIARMGGLCDGAVWHAHHDFGTPCGMIDAPQRDGVILRFILPMIIEFGLVKEISLQAISLTQG
jgi:hypothetical protein